MTEEERQTRNKEKEWDKKSKSYTDRTFSLQKRRKQEIQNKWCMKRGWEMNSSRIRTIVLSNQVLLSSFTRQGNFACSPDHELNYEERQINPESELSWISSKSKSDFTTMTAGKCDLVEGETGDIFFLGSPWTSPSGIHPKKDISWALSIFQTLD